jgi:hypothetical protein
VIELESGSGQRRLVSRPGREDAVVLRVTPRLSEREVTFASGGVTPASASKRWTPSPPDGGCIFRIARADHASAGLAARLSVTLAELSRRTGL